MLRALVCLSLLFVPVTASAQTAADTLADVKAFYGGIKQMKADFEQEVTYATFNRTAKNTGTLELKRKAKMRWDYQSKRTGDVEKSFLSNGKKLWYVDHGNKQWSVKKLNQTILPVAVTFLTGKGNLTSQFNAALDTSGTYGGKGQTVVELTPKVASTQYDRLYLVVDAGGAVAESVVIDPQGNVNRFRFSNVDTTTTVANKRFVPDKSKLRKYRRVT